MVMEGILPVLKPVGFTSHDVVAKVRKILGMKRIGHTGTLDPQVIGVLPLCLGRATRVVEYIQDLPKEYEAELIFGFSTDTEDLSGAVISQVDNVELSEEQIRQTVQSFIGVIDQVPPMYSAVKVNGKRLYELARQGQEVERKSRKVQIYHISVLSFSLDESFPKVKFKVSCSKGTYIRTLCADIGKALGYPAVMSDLARTATGNITIKQCLSLNDIEELYKTDRLSAKIIPTDQAIDHLQAFYVAKTEAKMALTGRHVSVFDLSPEPALIQEPIRLYSQADEFIGIFNIDWQQNVVVPIKVFS